MTDIEALAEMVTMAMAEAGYPHCFAYADLTYPPDLASYATEQELRKAVRIIGNAPDDVWRQAWQLTGTFP